MSCKAFIAALALLLTGCGSGLVCPTLQDAHVIGVRCETEIVRYDRGIAAPINEIRRVDGGKLKSAGGCNLLPDGVYYHVVPGRWCYFRVTGHEVGGEADGFQTFP